MGMYANDEEKRRVHSELRARRAFFRSTGPADMRGMAQSSLSDLARVRVERGQSFRFAMARTNPKRSEWNK